jgi:hypothetical protein
LHQKTVIGNISLMGFNKRKLEDQRREAADKEATNRRSTDALVALDAKARAAWRYSPQSAAPRLS